MPGAYLGGINNAGDLVGTANDAQLITPDYAWLDINGGELATITPDGGRATDVNNVLQVCGYSQGPATAFQAFRWSQKDGIVPLGSLGLAYSFAHRMNDAGDVVGVATSASGHTDHAWIYTDDDGMQPLPAPFFNASTAISINNSRHVVGISSISGPDLNWLWTGGEAVTNITSLFDTAEAQMNVIEVRDISDAGQILVQVFDNSVPDFRMVILTPPVVNVPGDLNNDGAVGPADLAELLANWGECPGCPPDLNGDGMVGPADLAQLLANWAL